MIDYINVKKIGFKKAQEKDSVYEDQFGRPYWYMEFLANVSCMGFTNEITFNWDCDTRIISVFKNNSEKIAEFSDFEEFVKYFSIFTEQKDN